MWKPLAVAALALTAAVPASAQPRPDADIVGIRLGMTMEEAEKIVRAHMKVLIVTVHGEKSTGNTNWNTKPWWEFKSFHAAKNEEVVMLVNGEPDGKKVIGVVRYLTLPRELSGKINEPKVEKILLEKYGRWNLQNRYSLYPVYHWATEKSPHCLFQTMQGPKAAKVIEGFPIQGEPNPNSPTPTFQVRPSGWDDFPRIAPLYKQCGLTVSAENEWGGQLFVALYDFSLIAPYYERPRPGR